MNFKFVKIVYKLSMYDNKPVNEGTCIVYIALIITIFILFIEGLYLLINGYLPVSIQIL